MTGRAGKRPPSRVIGIYVLLDPPYMDKYIEMTQALSRTLSFEQDFPMLNMEVGDHLLQGSSS